MTPPDRDSVYNDYVWKPAPRTAHTTNSKQLSPRAKAGIGAGAVVLAATGMVAWSNYSAAQANAEVQREQVSLEQSRLDLQRQKQDAELAQAAEKETPAQKARREAVQRCVAKAGSSFNGIADCGKAYPAVDTPGTLNTAQSVAAATSDGGSHSGVGLVVLGGVGAVVAVGWAKKRLAR